MKKFHFVVVPEMDWEEGGGEKKKRERASSKEFPKLSSCLKQSRNWKGGMEEEPGTIC